ncbi:hypothetical protein P8907_20615 [Bacillus atrophaeus]|uniref:hypothetical protein n=1 Tax=Bacillus atrophaeus TaxID=1452 RepID=UPI00227E7ACA|nr:hypothetical protein [Bacillus atrophaeus]MCY8810634.1 hypothetical protein [Bacillus atrophaeus]MCY8907787.1 hypothetical protein [Bacillus atrophaeus]MEC0837792.1 hypothetical protein [Bacillus atrophaeus]MEC0847693.1 hypothetical protein [Bacillus atrophaeus]MEC0849913.1 hypothetical protein [Bacillus atrophaeus]
MKAYRVYYNTGGKQTSKVILSPDESQIENNIAAKDKDYKIGSRFCQVTRVSETPLSSVMVADLSVTELLMLFNFCEKKEGAE